MFAPQYQPDPRLPGVGLGFYRRVVDGHLIIEKSGLPPGFASQMCIAPDDGVAVVAFTNGARNGHGWLGAETSALLGHVLGVADESIRTDVAHRPELWSELCGWYALRGSVLAARGYSPEIVELAQCWFNGEVPPKDSFRTLMKLGNAYNPHSGIRDLAREMLRGAWRSKLRPEALIFATRNLAPGWTVRDRLAEIEVPTLVMAGEDDFIFPPEHQAQLVAGLPHARLKLTEHAGHNPHDEQTAEVMKELRAFVGPEP